jgi:hypothetical protein
MKRSEMIERLRDFLSYEQGYREDWSYAEDIVDFIISQGMLPPTCTIEKPLTPNMPIYDRHGKIKYKATVNEWEKEND